MNISAHLDKKNLHHAYLIEGNREEILPEVLEFIKSLGINTVGNGDLSVIQLDSFKIEDARNLKSYASEKGFSSDPSLLSGKKIFIISANSFLLEAQNTMLKMFEEPIENTHFFLIVPDVNSLLQTLVSRFYLIRWRGESGEEAKNAEKFIKLPLKDRIDFIKELLAEVEEENDEGEEIIPLDSTRSKALKFLNALETSLHSKLVRDSFGSDPAYLDHFFKVREFLRMPGSSTKTLMESVALIVPILL